MCLAISTIMAFLDVFFLQKFLCENFATFSNPTNEIILEEMGIIGQRHY